MNNIKTIHPAHPLSRFYVHDPPLNIGRHIRVSSVEAARWYLSLLQDGKTDVAAKLINTARLMAHPLKIAEWVKEECGGLSPKLIFNAASIYMDIFIDQLQRDNSSFRLALQCALNNSSYPSSLMFIMCCSDNEYVWSCGLRETVFDRSPYAPGFNVYGNSLSIVSQAFISGSSEPVLGELRHYHDRSLGLEIPFPKTVLLIGDSQCRQVEEIDCGRIVSISGGVFKDAVAFADQYEIDFSQYAVVIFSFGINDMQKPFSKMRQSWAVLEKRLRQELRRPNCPKFVISLPFPHTDVGNAIYDCNFIYDTTALSGPNVFWLHWGVEPGCPFQIDGVQNLGLLDHDRFHLNHSGFRELWSKWAELVEDLKLVSYKIGKQRRVYKKAGNSDFVQNW